MDWLSKCSLKEIDAETSSLVRDWRNQEHIRTMMFNQEIISLEDHEKWIASLNNNLNRIVKVFFFDNNPMGVVSFSRLSFNDPVYEWGFYIGNIDAPRGMGTYLAITAIDYYFSKLAENKLYAEVLAFNKKSLVFHEKLGFIEEGIETMKYELNQKYYDIHSYGMLKETWLEHRRKLIKKLGAYENDN